MIQRKFLHSRKIFVFNIIFLSMATGFGMGIILFMNAANPKNQIWADSNSNSVEVSNNLIEIQNAFRAVAKTVLPSIVKIIVESDEAEPELSFPFPFEFFFDNNQPPSDKKKRHTEKIPRRGFGSGVIIHAQGDKVHVLTNRHVVEGAKKISVKLLDETEYDATVVDGGGRRDVALVSFNSEGKKISVAKKGNSDELQVGDFVFALGNPFNLDFSVTQGIISALNRRKGPDRNYIDTYIQTDAAINKGNSGGALVNIKGELIGINTWIASPSGTSAGLGFAIPINSVSKVIEDILVHGKVREGWIGVLLDSINSSEDDGLTSSLKEEFFKSLKLPSNSDGALVNSILKGGPANQAGILPGDYITAVDDNKITDMQDLVVKVNNLTPGQGIVFTLIRQGKIIKKTVNIALRGSDKEMASQKYWPGITVRPRTKQLLDELGIDSDVKGVVILNLEQSSVFSIAGLQRGDTITAINKKPITTVSGFYQQLNTETPEVALTFQRQGVELNISIAQ